MRTVTIHATRNVPIFLIGLSDAHCPDPLNDGIYSAKPYEARNTHPPHNGNPIPEVRKFGNGSICYLTEPVEHLVFTGWRWTAGITEATALKYYPRHMRDDAAYTNKCGINTPRRSWVMKTNLKLGDMRFEGVDCPGGNLFRVIEEKTYDIKGIPSYPVWVLDYHYIKLLSVADAIDLAKYLPKWIMHFARIVHSDGTTTNWDADFAVPCMTSDAKQPTAVIDGIPCRRDFMRASRLQRL